jgi:hypothetical protein
MYNKQPMDNHQNKTYYEQYPFPYLQNKLQMILRNRRVI